MSSIAAGIFVPVVMERSSARRRSSENQVVRPGELDLYIKLTYSVIREDVNKDGSPSKDIDDKTKKPPKWHMSTPVRASHTRAVLSSLGVASRVPSGLNATQTALPVCPLHSWICSPVRVFHRRTV